MQGKARKSSFTALITLIVVVVLYYFYAHYMESRLRGQDQQNIVTCPTPSEIAHHRDDPDIWYVDKNIWTIFPHDDPLPNTLTFYQARISSNSGPLICSYRWQSIGDEVKGGEIDVQLLSSTESSFIPLSQQSDKPALAEENMICRAADVKQCAFSMFIAE